ncbi:S1C family serine protease [Cyclobacterium plantarum]|uniref:Trypsin-like serine protease n=1 Tax=Cyclobacterium plantarum TaxID=2716263 RepID=A0ABX0HF02_9BACT|nr:trypsin-like peptidase domain-containing protein [Cyclobacterium plantarum]NHE58595.1 trypsin-like serine protease [Cyclobacterium plantarum]
MLKNLLLVVVSFLAGILGAWFFTFALEKEFFPLSGDESNQHFGFQTTNIENTTPDSFENPAPHPRVDPESFIVASENSTNSVVFIKNFSGTDSRRYSVFDYFFGQGAPQQTVSTGSGVIFSADGYIITNNHVIDRAETIEVIHKKRTYKASLIGADANTDIAVLKIEAENLPAIEIGSSRNLQIGEWVLAVGNPFNLTSTVTAGIVSAKERQINIMGGEFPLESFIQTDAPINPGNSGGALVNVKGELVGINTAILSRTGSYTGYGFAVPVDIAAKIANDLIRYGEVQKAIPGLEVEEITPELADQMNLNSLDGVIVSRLIRDGAAANSGIKVNDVIIGIDGNPVSGKGSFEEALSYYYPGDKITVQFRRGNELQKSELTLQNLLGGTGVIKRTFYTSPLLGAKLEKINAIERDRYGIDAGIKITGLTRGYLNDLGLGEGFILTRINDEIANDPEEVGEFLEEYSGSLKLEGLTPGGRPFVQSYSIR